MSLNALLKRGPFAKAPARILVVCTRRIGDVLLTTPLIRSLKKKWPGASIDMLVFRGTEGVLKGNPDLHEVIAVAHRQPWRQTLRDLGAIRRKYDIAITPMSSDRSRMYLWVSGRWRLGVVEAKLRDWPKRLMLSRAMTIPDNGSHVVQDAMRIAREMAAVPTGEVVPPVPTEAERQQLRQSLAPLAGRAYAVLHLRPKYRYKMWTDEGWFALAQWLQQRGLAVVLTGGGDIDELNYVEALAQRLPGMLNLAGKLSFAQTAALIASAELYVGPDTATTHTAAATGTPVVTMFGPTPPDRWGPWPHTWDSLDNPWQRRGSAHRGNVYLVQGPGECVPCGEEGCDRHIDSDSACLQNLPASQVIAAAQVMLDLKRRQPGVGDAERAVSAAGGTAQSVTAPRAVR